MAYLYTICMMIKISLNEIISLFKYVFKKYVYVVTENGKSVSDTIDREYLKKKKPNYKVTNIIQYIM